MPAWSVPGTQSALRPLMRRQRVRMSISVWLSMCPMCRRPVTLGGGSRMVNGDWPSRRSLCGRVAPERSRLGEKILADPVFGPVIFNGGRVVGFGQVVRHDLVWKSPECAQNPDFRRVFERWRLLFRVADNTQIYGAMRGTAGKKAAYLPVSLVKMEHPSTAAWAPMKKSAKTPVFFPPRRR